MPVLSGERPDKAIEPDESFLRQRRLEYTPYVGALCRGLFEVPTRAYVVLVRVQTEAALLATRDQDLRIGKVCLCVRGIGAMCVALEGVLFGVWGAVGHRPRWWESRLFVEDVDDVLLQQGRALRRHMGVGLHLLYERSQEVVCRRVLGAFQVLMVVEAVAR